MGIARIPLLVWLAAAVASVAAAFSKGLLQQLHNRNRAMILSQMQKRSTILRAYADDSSPPTPKRGLLTKAKLGVLLLNLGGPERIEDVEGFLYNLFADPDIIRLPPYLSFAQKPLAFTIAKSRAPKSSKNYESIGGGSPIVKYTSAQADLIRDAILRKLDNSSMGDVVGDVKCYFAMRYWNPYTEEVLEQIQRDGIDSLVIVPLYPQYSISTSGSSLKLLQEIFSRFPEQWGSDKIMHTVVPSWYHRPGYITAMASLVVKEVLAFSKEEMREGIHVLFSAHGVPQSYIASGDPYQDQIEECVRLISREVATLLKREEEGGGGLAMETRAQLAGVGSAVGALPPLRVSRLRKLPQSKGGAKLEWNDDQSSARWVTGAEAEAEEEMGTRTETETETETVHAEQVPVVAAVSVPVPLPDKLQWSADGTSACWDMEAVPVEAAPARPEPALGATRVPEAPVREVQYHLSFQSKVGPVKWLQPYTEEKIVELADPYGPTRARNLVVVPVSFVSEHIETLEEIDMEYRELAEQSGVQHWRRVPALNMLPLFIEDMADMALEALEAPALSVSEAAARHSDVIESYGSAGASAREAEFLGWGGSGGGGGGAEASQSSVEAEVLNGRAAMVGIVGTALLELANGHPIVQMIARSN